MFGLPFDPSILNNLQGLNSNKSGSKDSDFLKDLDPAQIENIMNSMGIGMNSFDNDEHMSKHGINKVVNHFMVMARSGFLKQEDIQKFECEPFETENEYGFKLVWRK